MKKLNYLGYCFLVVSLVACAPSKSKTSGTEESMETENVKQIEEISLTDIPLELADFTVECFIPNEREKLLPYATKRYNKRLTEDMAIEKQMKNNRGIKEIRKRLMKVLLELQEGKWMIDQVGLDR